MSVPSDARFAPVDPRIQTYLAELAGADDPLLDEMEAHCIESGFPLIGRESGRWLELLTRSIGGRRVFELGSGFGYSAYFFARAVGEGGEVLGSEKDAHELERHQRFFAGHPLAPRIELRQGWAEDVLAGTEGLFDVIFMDIDKSGYPSGLEAAIPRLRVGGLILADNALWGGRVASGDRDASTEAIHRFNQMLHRDSRLQASILPAGDGLAVGLRVA
jgi:predicted O-methyltransferase YrrM